MCLNPRLSPTETNKTSKSEIIKPGGPNTVKTVHASIQVGTPVLVVGGSGKAADIIADAWRIRNRKVEVSNTLIGEFEKLVKNLLLQKADLEKKAQWQYVLEEIIKASNGELQEKVKNVVAKYLGDQKEK